MPISAKRRRNASWLFFNLLLIVSNAWTKLDNSMYLKDLESLNEIFQNVNSWLFENFRYNFGNGKYITSIRQRQCTCYKKIDKKYWKILCCNIFCHNTSKDRDSSKMNAINKLRHLYFLYTRRFGKILHSEPKSLWKIFKIR